LKEAIVKYIRPTLEKPGAGNLYEHLMANEWDIDWASNGEELAISIDGEIEDNTQSSVLYVGHSTKGTTSA
jgi:hypothetical protein